jgi:DNA-binding NtrC family response regulator
MSDLKTPESGPQRRVMVVEDDNSFGELLRYHLKREGYETHIIRTGEEALARMAEIEPELLLLDIMLPGKDGCALLGEIHPLRPEMPIVMMTAAGSVEMAVDCMKRGAYDFLTKPFDFDRLQTIVRNALNYRELKARVQALEGALVKAHGFDQIIAQSGTMKQVVDQSRRASQSDSDVLILGESGSGKEVLARAIHFNSMRRKGPFVAINCGAIPESLLESELFGHEKGAFTGAVGRRAGCFEQADGGTLFLDEIGEMRPDMQVRLLRALENREIRRVGGDRTIKVNTRVISATNQNIAQNIKTNLFRPDLYYRLAILVLEVPPLREHPEDIAALAQHFLDDARKDGHTRATRISQQALEVLVKYPWPGNVRELRNAIERAVVFEDSLAIMLNSLPPEILRVSALNMAATPPGNPPAAPASTPFVQSSPVPANAASQPEQAAPGAPLYPEGIDPAIMRGPADGEILTLDEEEKRVILRTLSITSGNISDAARRLGVHRSTLHRKMTRYGLATDEQMPVDALENEQL